MLFFLKKNKDVLIYEELNKSAINKKVKNQNINYKTENMTLTISNYFITAFLLFLNFIFPFRFYQAILLIFEKHS